MRARRLLPLAALAVLLPAAARAGVEGTAHDVQFAVGSELCAACHVSDPSAGGNVWATEPFKGGIVGSVAGVCASCHHSLGAYGAAMSRAWSDDHAYGAESHGQRMWLATAPAATDVAASGLPAVDAAHGTFECSTCHSVHDDTYRPFLREPANVLCARCHKLRHYVNGVDQSGAAITPGAWVVPANLGLKNPGSHPVGDDVTGVRDGAPAVTIPALFRTPFSTRPAEWSLGGHLSAGADGGVTCITCHAVHGVGPDSDDVTAAGTAAAPNPGFLVVAQATASIPGAPRPVPNGSGGTSALCEACHGVGNNPSTAPDGAGWSDSRYNVSPGAEGTASHPVDSFPSGYDAGVTAFPPNWPAGDPAIAGRNVGPVPVCGTCHAAHPAAALAAGRGDVLAGAGAYALRAPATLAQGEPICDLCHTATIPGHHPVEKAFDSRGVPYLSSVTAGQGDILTCTTCHGGAHGWAQPGWAGLDPAWKPWTTAGPSLQADDMYDPDMSQDVHGLPLLHGRRRREREPDPGLQTDRHRPGRRRVRPLPGRRPQPGHPLRRARPRGAATGGSNPWVDVFDTSRTWKDQNSATPAGSHRDGRASAARTANGSRVLVCESCHELEPDKNGGFRHLLLAPYEEGQDGYDEYAGDTDGHDVLCVACHGIPAGTHPMTGMIVSRTGLPLDADAEWLRPGDPRVTPPSTGPRTPCRATRATSPTTPTPTPSRGRWTSLSSAPSATTPSRRWPPPRSTPPTAPR